MTAPVRPCNDNEIYIYHQRLKIDHIYIHYLIDGIEKSAKIKRQSSVYLKEGYREEVRAIYWHK
jgi:hypothetical protein